MSISSYTEQLREMEEQNRLMRTLGTRTGFYEFYFKELGKRNAKGGPKHRTNFECFNYVNELYLGLFGEERYTSYNSFRNAYTKYLATK